MSSKTTLGYFTEDDEPWWAHADDLEEIPPKPEQWACRTEAERKAMEAWVNAQLDDKEEELFLARQSLSALEGIPAALSAHWAQAAIQERNIERLVELTADADARRRVFERLLRPPGRPAGDTPIKGVIRMANERVDWVLDLWREHYGRQRGVLDWAVNIVIERDKKLGYFLTESQLKDHRRGKGREVPNNSRVF